MLALAQLQRNKREAGLDAHITEAEADALVNNMRVREFTSLCILCCLCHISASFHLQACNAAHEFTLNFMTV